MTDPVVEIGDLRNWNVLLSEKDSFSHLELEVSSKIPFYTIFEYTMI